MDLNVWHILWVLIHGPWMPSRAFNLDTKRPTVFRGPEEAQFGFSVQQHYASGKNWLLVGAPWKGSAGTRPGDVYRCPLGLGSEVTNSSCEKLGLEKVVSVPSVTEVKENMNLGMNLAPGPDPGSFTVCAPLWAQECGSSYFAPGICSNVDSGFNVSESYAPTLQKCGSYMDIVFVLDGSNSIYPWSDVQNFLVKTLQSFHIGPDQTQVGIVQYGEVATHEFDLGDFRSTEEAVDAARRVRQLRGNETHTAKGVFTARSEAFSPERGARPDAQKVMIVVTDGESHDKYLLPEVIDQCERDGITRYAIAVLRSYSSNADDVARLINEVRSIASHPVERHFFNVTSEATLIDIVGTLGERIFSLEGTREKNETSFDLELSQAGFSAHYVGGALMLGAVGAYEWMGTIVRRVGDEVSLPGKHAFESALPSELRSHAAYLGYSLTSARTENGSTILVAGAPRFNHTGRTVVFTQDHNSKVSVLKTLSGEQIGSYFGGEVCAMDVDGDSVSDVLLVAAPMFMDSSSRETGRVYLYTFSPQGVLEWSAHLSPAESQDSRFGSALAAVPDLNQDGWGELAVGAPLEDERQGAVYLFQGHGRSLRTTHVQRVAASQLGHGLLLFGRSLHAQLDVDGNEIADVAVGSLGAAVVIWSRGIVEVEVATHFDPGEIDIWSFTCEARGRSTFCVESSVCLTARTSAPKPEAQHVAVVYNVTIDASRLAPRALFEKHDERRLLREAILPYNVETCSRFKIYMLEASDYVKPLGVRVDFRMADPDSGPVLNLLKPKHVEYMIPFKKDCGDDDQCITDLVLSVNTDASGSTSAPFLISSTMHRVLLNVTLHNKLENAYNTRLNVSLSPNLHFSNVMDQAEKAVKINCHSLAHATGRVCEAGYPVFKSNTKISRLFEFKLSETTLLNHIDFQMEAMSDSDELPDTMHDNAFHLSLPVRYQADTILLRQTNIEYIEILKDVRPPNIIKSFNDIGTIFKFTITIENTGPYLLEHLQVNVSIPAFSQKGNPLLYITHVDTFPPHKVRCHTGNIVDPFTVAQSQPRAVFLAEDFMAVRELNCKTAKCATFLCTIKRMDKHQTLGVKVTTRLWNSTFHTGKLSHVRIVAPTTLHLLNSSLMVIKEGHGTTNVTVEVIKRGKYVFPFWIILASVLGGLLLLALIILALWKVTSAHIDNASPKFVWIPHRGSLQGSSRNVLIHVHQFNNSSAFTESCWLCRLLSSFTLCEKLIVSVCFIHHLSCNACTGSECIRYCCFMVCQLRDDPVLVHLSHCCSVLSLSFLYCYQSVPINFTILNIFRC
uniref:Integrin alpha-11-like isoform X1 n=1 Tax=Petromyzon marinus TaxID=7757 RepID=A0AAJ7T108_PETMA|nr:integrin alpha-11-like isoform X1 [Petromyzon marinus]